MDNEFQQSLPEDYCDCKIRNIRKVRRYKHDDNFIGIFCPECKVECLTSRYIFDASINNNSLRLHRRPQPTIEINFLFQEQIPKTEVSLDNFGDLLTPGDHIAWHRLHIYWHHAIVTEVRVEESTLKVIEWKNLGTLLKPSFKIVEGDYLVTKEQFYRIDYPEAATKGNPPELILARARSRIDDTGYWLSTDNCETFAAFCRYGVETSVQIEWVKKELYKIRLQLDNVLGKATWKVIYKSIANCSVVKKEIVQNAVKVCRIYGAGLVIIFELSYLVIDLKKAYKLRTNGSLSISDFVRLVVQRVTQGLVCASGALIVSNAFGILIGGIVGGLLGELAGYTIGKPIGTVVGSLIGCAISGFIKWNDRAVTSITDLHPGDHIVMSGWSLHPRCHAIVLCQDGEMISVIRNTHERGVVNEWIPFKTPLYRIEYGPGRCYRAEEVLRNAYSRMGEQRYNLATYNCKTFARQCKSDFR